MNQNAILGTFWPLLLLEPFGLYVSMLHVERMRLIISPTRKNGEGFIAQKSPKIEKGPFYMLCWPFLAIFRSFHMMII